MVWPDRRGLSPRVRGNPARHQSTSGSIPACAGEPAATDRRPSHGSIAWTRSAWAGSIPACAGEPTGNYRQGAGPRGWRCRGSIPACAGEPERSGHHRPSIWGGTMKTLGLARRAVYPRVCGEPCPRAPPGSIPACAGEPLCHNDPVSHEYVKDQWTLRRSTGHAANQSPHKLRVRQRSMAGSFDNDGLDLARSGEGGVKPSPLLISAHCALPRATNWG